MPDPKNPGENQGAGQEEALPGTDFYESEAVSGEQVKGDRIGATFDELDHRRRDGDPGKQAE